MFREAVPEGVKVSSSRSFAVSAKIDAAAWWPVSNPTPAALDVAPKSDAIGSEIPTRAVTDAAVGSAPISPENVTTFPTRIHWQRLAEVESMFATLVSVGVQVPEAMYWVAVPVTAPALLWRAAP